MNFFFGCLCVTKIVVVWHPSALYWPAATEREMDECLIRNNECIALVSDDEERIESIGKVLDFLLSLH